MHPTAPHVNKFSHHADKMAAAGHCNVCATRATAGKSGRIKHSTIYPSTRIATASAYGMPVFFKWRQDCQIKLPPPSCHEDPWMCLTSERSGHDPAYSLLPRIRGGVLPIVPWLQNPPIRLANRCASSCSDTNNGPVVASTRMYSR